MTFLGKLATWILYAALGFVLVTEEGTTWPLVILWIGIGLALAAGVQYVVQARRVLAGADSGREAPAEREETLKLRLTPGNGCCFTPETTRKGDRWNHSPISRR